MSTKLNTYADICMRNNFATRKIINSILDSITTVYKYLEHSYNKEFIRMYRNTIIKITGIFGLVYERPVGSDVDVDKFVRLGIDLREDVRKVVIDNKGGIDKGVVGSIFGVLDDFRDNKLREAGVVLQDRTGDSTKYTVK